MATPDELAARVDILKPFAHASPVLKMVPLLLELWRAADDVHGQFPPPPLQWWEENLHQALNALREAKI